MREIPGISLSRAMEIPRACFITSSHSGRGSELIREDLDHQATRDVVDLIIDETRKCFDAGKPEEILTVDTHADGPISGCAWPVKTLKEPEGLSELLVFNEGNNSGRGIGCISWGRQVHADQLWREHVFGNVLEKTFLADLG